MCRNGLMTVVVVGLVITWSALAQEADKAAAPPNSAPPTTSRGVAGPWEFRIVSFRAAESCEVRHMTIKGGLLREASDKVQPTEPNLKLALVRVICKGQRAYTDKELKACETEPEPFILSRMRVAADAGRFKLFLTRGCFYLLSEQTVGAEKKRILRKCRALSAKPEEGVVRGDWYVYTKKDSFDATYVFDYSPEDMSPVLIFFPIPAVAAFDWGQAVQINLGPNGDVVSLSHSILADLGKPARAQLDAAKKEVNN